MHIFCFKISTKASLYNAQHFFTVWYSSVQTQPDDTGKEKPGGLALNVRDLTPTLSKDLIDLRQDRNLLTLSAQKEMPKCGKNSVAQERYQYCIQ
jgi:hypothetical protein